MTTLVAFCPACGVIGDIGDAARTLAHTRGCTRPTVEITNRLRTIRWRRERKRDGWYAEDVDYLLGLVERSVTP